MSMIKESVWTIGDVNPKCPFNSPFNDEFQCKSLDLQNNGGYKAPLHQIILLK